MGPRGKEALPALNNFLKDPDPAVKMAGVRAIMMLDRGNKARLAVLSEVAQSPDAAARTQAVMAGLAIFPRSNDLAPIYRAGLKANGTGVRSAAVQALWEVDRTCVNEIVPVLIDELKQPIRNGIRQAVITLGQIGPDAKAAIPQLAALVKKPEEQINQSQIIQALGRMGPDALPVLGDLLKDPTVINRFQALDALVQHGEAGLAILLPLLKDENLQMRMQATITVGRFGKHAAPAVPQLIELLKDPQQAIHHNVVMALGSIGPAAKNAVPALVEYIKNVAQPAVYRANAVAALGRIGPDAKSSVETIRELLKDPDTNLRFASAEAIVAISGKDEEARDTLLDLIALAPRGVRHTGETLATALDASGAEAKDVIPRLAERMKSAYMAADLAHFLSSRYGEDPAAVPLLKELLTKADPVGQPIVAVILAKHGAEGKAAIPILMDKAKHDANFSTDTSQVLSALAELGPNAREAFDELMTQWTNSQNIYRRVSARGNAGQDRPG